MNENIEKIVKQYKINAEIHMNSTYSGEFKTGNKASKKLLQYNNKFKSDIELGRMAIDKLLLDDNPNVVIWIAGVAIDIKYSEDIAIESLVKIAKDEKIGIIGFNAEMSLQVRGIPVL